MLAAASLAKVVGVSIREMYETEDANLIMFTSAVVDRTVDARNDIAREIQRRSRGGH